MAGIKLISLGGGAGGKRNGSGESDGKNLKPEIDLVAKWVKEAWDSIPAEMIEKSFKKCCISNALDGTEDDAIFKDDVDDVENDNDEEKDDAEDIYDNGGAPMTEAEFHELFGE